MRFPLMFASGGSIHLCERPFHTVEWTLVPLAAALLFEN
jgi:hypothetical protein